MSITYWVIAILAAIFVFKFFTGIIRTVLTLIILGVLAFIVMSATGVI